MLIWTMTILLLVLFGALGYVKGAIRMVFPLLGLFVGAVAALPLSPLLRPLVPKVGLTNPVWSILLPPVVVFLVIALVFIGVGFFGHAKVNLFYKYRADDTQRMGWERLNQRLGVCMGLIAGTVYTILIGVVVLVIGYLTVQISPGDSDASMAKYLNQARAELRTSGLEKLAAAFDPAPDWYYQGADLLGLLYHNPPLHSRLASYPAIIPLAERQELQELASDTEFQNLLAGQPSVGQVVENQRIQTILGNKELLEQFRALDLKDLHHYLRTGVSEKYQDTPLLGRWELDPYLTFLIEKKRRKGMTAVDVKLLRFEMEYVKGFKLLLAPDNSVRLKGPDITQVIGKLAELAKSVSEGTKPRPTAYVVAPTPQPQPIDSAAQRAAQQMASRYGTPASRGVPNSPPAVDPAVLAAAQAAAAQAAQAAAPPMTTAMLEAEIAKLPMTTLAQGQWREEGGKYLISFEPTKEMNQFVGTRRSASVEASVRDDRLYVMEKGQGLVMSRF